MDTHFSLPLHMGLEEPVSKRECIIWVRPNVVKLRQYLYVRRMSLLLTLPNVFYNVYFVVILLPPMIIKCFTKLFLYACFDVTVEYC